MDKENLFTFPHNFPYDIPESDTEEDIAGMFRRFSHSTSIQAKSLFSISAENNIRWSSFNHSPAPSPPSLFGSDDADSWNLICEAARMKMKVSNFPVEEFFRQREYSRGCGRRDGYGLSAWGPPKIGGGMAAKREYAGTGVFLPRRYCACLPANLPPRMMNQSSNKTFVPITSRPEIQARFNVVSIPNYEMLMSRRNALILATQQQRRSNMHHNMHRGVMEPPMNNNINPEVLLPQEWTY